MLSWSFLLYLITFASFSQATLEANLVQLF